MAEKINTDYNYTTVTLRRQAMKIIVIIVINIPLCLSPSCYSLIVHCLLQLSLQAPPPRRPRDKTQGVCNCHLYATARNLKNSCRMWSDLVCLWRTLTWLIVHHKTAWKGIHKYLDAERQKLFASSFIKIVYYDEFKAKYWSMLRLDLDCGKANFQPKKCIPAGQKLRCMMKTRI